MNLLLRSVLTGAAASLLLSSCATTGSRSSGEDALLADVPVPVDIGMRVTYAGVVFTDKRGMTLYWTTLDNQNPGTSHCNAQYKAPASTDHPLLHVYYEMYKDKAASCSSQWPPVLVSPGAKPVEKWSIITRVDGTKQWAYNNLPVYTSYKDQLPGDVNGVLRDRYGSVEYGASIPGLLYHWDVALAPARLPPGVGTLTRNDYGVIATTSKGALYVPRRELLEALEGDPGVPKTSAPRMGAPCTYDCPELWRPFVAGMAANPLGHWTIRERADGLRQWLFKGEPVYTFAGDQFPEHLNGIAGGLPVTLVPVPERPASIQTRYTGLGETFTNVEGRTLYAFYCNLRVPGSAQTTNEKVSCSNWSDDVMQREQFCPASDRCAEKWRPHLAPADAQPSAGMWSVAVIPDPERYPLRWYPVNHPAARAPGAVKVWTHRGRPLYTFEDDKYPLEFRGHHIFHNSGHRWTAVVAGLYQGDS